MIDVERTIAAGQRKAPEHPPNLGKGWSKRAKPWLLAAFFGVAAFLCVATWFGSVQAAVFWIRGHPAIAEFPRDSIGLGKPGTVLTFSVAVRSLTERAIRIVGATTNCSCSWSAGVLPARLEPWQTIDIPFEFRIQDTEAKARVQVTVYYVTENEDGSENSHQAVGAVYANSR